MIDLGKKDLKPRRKQQICATLKLPHKQLHKTETTKMLSRIIWLHRSHQQKDLLLLDYLNCFCTTHAHLDFLNCYCYTLCIFWGGGRHIMLQQYILWTLRSDTNFLKTNTQDIAGKHYCSQSILSILHLM